jgi:hypothetical protein
MAEKGYPFTNNATGDGTSGGYTAAEWRKIHRYLFGDGVALEGNRLAVTGTASPLAVNTGHAVVDGLFYDNTASVNLAVATPSVGTTGGHVIIRADYSAQTVRLVAVRNTDGNAATPSLTQTSETTYEIRLATFSITTGGVITLTDARTYLHMYQMVATANIDLNAVTNTIIRDSAALSVIGRAANSTGDPADIAASAASGAVLRESGGTIGFGAVATAGIANDAVDDTKVGSRVAQFYRRQGGSATDWTAQGATPRTPTAVREQIGVARVSFSASNNASVVVTFPAAFSNKPIVMVSMMDQIGILSGATWCNAEAISTTQFTLTVRLASATTTTLDFAWRASGDE